MELDLVFFHAPHNVFIDKIFERSQHIEPKMLEYFCVCLIRAVRLLRAMDMI